MTSILLYWCSVALLALGVSGLKFTDDVYTVTITETPADDSNTNPMPPPPKSGVVLTAGCTQDDFTPVNNSSDLRFSVQQNVNAALFSINAITGEFSVADVPFDYETQPWYLVNLTCYLESGSENGTGAVNVSIGPVNEYYPIIQKPSNQQRSIFIREDAAIESKIVSVDSSVRALQMYTATDRDAGIDSVIEYSSNSSSVVLENIFELNKNTGTLTLRQSVDVDKEVLGFKKFEIEITACNEGLPFRLCNNIVYTVFFTPVNDNVPMFDQSQYSVRISESAPNGTLVVQAICTDKDVSIGAIDNITFHKNTSEEILTTFELNSDGNVSVQSELDYENTTGYQFMLSCSDGGNVTATTQVIVNVLPVNDNLPHFEMNHYEFTADRTDPSPSDTIIGTVRATDNDEGDVGALLKYSIISSSYFSIDEDTGEITLKDYLHISDGGIFSFDVIASDGEYQTMASVRVMINGLLSVPEWIYVGIAGVVVLIILVVIGIIVCYCFIRAARIRIVERYRESLEDGDISVIGNYPAPEMVPMPGMFIPEGSISMVGQPLYPDLEGEDDFHHSETPEDSEFQLSPTPGPVLKEMVDYFQEGDKMLNKKGGKK